MKIPATIDLKMDYAGIAKPRLGDVVKAYGKSRSLNEIGETIDCEDEAGTEFTITRFWNSRHIWRIA
jgi:dissimilatory sulfite reductase (desulfoviridin) alpha/beta subunit